MYHLFGGYHDEGAGMDGYAGVYATLKEAGVEVLKKRWDWADVARLDAADMLVPVATWRQLPEPGHDTTCRIQIGWLMHDATFMVIAIEESKPWPKMYLITNVWASPHGDGDGK